MLAIAGIGIAVHMLSFSSAVGVRATGVRRSVTSPISPAHLRLGGASSIASSVQTPSKRKGTPTTGPQIQIFVTIPNSKTFVLRIAPDATIATVKRMIRDKEGVPEDQQRIILKKKELENTRTLRSYGVADNDTLRLSLRLMGGMQEPAWSDHVDPDSHRVESVHDLWKEHDWIVRVLYYNPDRPLIPPFKCTGILYGRNKVITGAHCTYQRQMLKGQAHPLWTPLPSSQLGVEVIDNTDGEVSIRRYKVESFITDEIFPRMRGLAGCGLDVSIITLKENPPGGPDNPNPDPILPRPRKAIILGDKDACTDPTDNSVFIAGFGSRSDLGEGKGGNGDLYGITKLDIQNFPFLGIGVFPVAEVKHMTATLLPELQKKMGKEKLEYSLFITHTEMTVVPQNLGPRARYVCMYVCMYVSLLVYQIKDS